MFKVDGLTFFEAVSQMGCPYCGAITVKTINEQGEILSGTVQHKDDCSWLESWRTKIKDMRDE